MVLRVIIWLFSLLCRRCRSKRFMASVGRSLFRLWTLPLKLNVILRYHTCVLLRNCGWCEARLSLNQMIAWFLIAHLQRIRLNNAALAATWNYNLSFWLRGVLWIATCVHAAALMSFRRFLCNLSWIALRLEFLLTGCHFPTLDAHFSSCTLLLATRKSLQVAGQRLFLVFTYRKTHFHSYKTRYFSFLTYSDTLLQRVLLCWL